MNSNARYQKYRLLFLIIGAALLALNSAGLFITPRLPDLATVAETRFTKDIVLSRSTFEKQLSRQDGETDRAYATRLSRVVADGLLHIKTRDQSKLDRFFRIRPTDNWIIHTLSYIYPRYWREYHYMNPERTVARGVGYCGDAALVAAWCLEKQGLSPRIVGFKGHVIAEVPVSSDVAASRPDTMFIDADFGVSIPGSVEKIRGDSGLIARMYLHAGFNQSDVDTLVKIYRGRPRYMQGYASFGPRKLMLENTLYALKWLVPAILLAASFLRKRRRGP